MKKTLSLMIVLALILLIFTGCAGQATANTNTSQADSTSSVQETDEVSPEPFTIGVALEPSGSVGASWKLNFATMVEALGGKVVYQANDFSSDGTILAVEKLITAGADGIMIVPFADSVLPRITQLCEEAGVYWSIFFRSINDEEVRKIVESSKYYVGNTYEDETNTAYDVGKMLGESGIKKIAIISTPKGDTTGDMREAGLSKACEEFGMEIVAEARGLSQSADTAKAVESFIASNPDLDVIFQLATTEPSSTTTVLKTINDTGKANQVKFSVIDFQDGLSEGLESGNIIVAAGGHLVVDPTLNMAMLINSVMGTPLSDSNMKVPISMVYLKNSADAKTYFEFVEGDTPLYGPEEIKQMLSKFYNPNVNVDGFLQVAEAYSIEDVRNRHGG